MFNQEFYPTPESVLDVMGIDCHNKIVLEPSAGKGDIIDYCKKWGAKEVIACEMNSDLRKIVQHKARVIENDFFKVAKEQVSHVQLIVMNPPFSNADRHINHAWDIAPDGCEIIALCNYETTVNTYGYSRSDLAQKINNYGEVVSLGDCFKQAERKTGVQVGLIRLFKPCLNEEGIGFDDFYLNTDEVIEDNAVIGFSEIRAVVNTYISAVKCFTKVEDLAKEMRSYTNVSFTGKQLENGDYEKHRLEFGHSIGFQATYRENAITTKEEFAKEFQKKCWSFIFNRVGMDKYVTNGVMQDINRFIENRRNYPFTVKNVHRMLDIIVGTRGDIMNRAIVEAVDNFTKHTHENRYGVEGWKTNEGHLLNSKFIMGWICEPNFSGKMRFSYHRQKDQLVDLTKALCYITGKKYEDIKQLHNLEAVNSNEWNDWGFFEYKLFKKGTGHFKFKDMNDWALLNQAYAKAKGFQLPERFTSSHKNRA